MKWPKSDKLMATGGFTMATIFFVILMFDFSLEPSSTSTKIIGKIVSLTNNAKSKFKDKVTWQALTTGTSIHNRSYIKSGEKSSLIINFGHGMNLFLAENSLVFVNFKDSTQDIEMKKGLLYAVKRSAQNNLSITMASNSIKILQGEINLAGSIKDKITVGRLKGNVLLQSKNSKAIKLTENTVLTSKKVTLGEKSEISLSSPSYRQRIPFNQRRNRIHLTWNNSNQQPMYYQVEVSKDYLFKTLLTKHITSSRSIDLFLAEGAYYWRIKSMLNNSKSVAGFFFLEKELKLKLLQPFHEKKIKYIKKFPGIQVLWNDLPQIYGYKLTVASDKKFTKEVVTFTTHNRYLFLEGKDYNRHKHLILYWKVNAISNSFNPQEITSSTHKIYFSRQKKIKPVIPISPRYDQQVSNWVLQSNHLTFSWQHSFLEKDPQTQYTLEVAKSNKFQSIIYRRVTTKLILKTNLNSRSKILYWRVISNKNKQKLFSKIMRFSITNKELETISPRFNASYDLTQVLHTGINLHWKSALITGTYSVIYGKKVNLRNAKKINLKNKKMIKLSLKQPGTYYWKVVFHSKDNSIIRETKVQVFKINKSLAIAKIIYPYNNQIINFSQIDYLTFRWKKVVGATQYIFKLFQISKHGVKFTPVVKIVTQVKSTFYNLVDLSKLDVARFYWTIKPIKQDNKARIIQAGPESQRYFSIYLPHQVSKLNLQVIE